MKKNKFIISLVLGSYLLLLGHLSIPAVNDVIFETPVEHAHPGSNLCHDHHKHHTENSGFEDFHKDDKHHCVYCCGHNNSLQFTINDKNFKLTELKLINFIVTDYLEYNPENNNERNQIYLQNPFEIPISEHLISAIHFRAPPQA